MTQFLSLKTRRYVRGVTLASIPLLIAYGHLGEEEAPLWVALVGAVLVPSADAAGAMKQKQKQKREQKYEPKHRKET